MDKEKEGFGIEDSGERQTFSSGMLRDVAKGKINFLLALDGPMFERWSSHLTRACEVKYPKRNWMKANSSEEIERAREAAMRHMFQWLRGDKDEDHAAAVFFNINVVEYVKGRVAQQSDLARRAIIETFETDRRP